METLTSDLVTQELDQLAFWKSNKAFYPPALSFLIFRTPPPLSPSAQIIPSHSPYLDEVPFIFKEKQGPRDADDGGEELLQRGLEKEREGSRASLQEGLAVTATQVPSSRLDPHRQGLAHSAMCQGLDVGSLLFHLLHQRLHLREVV